MTQPAADPQTPVDRARYEFRLNFGLLGGFHRHLERFEAAVRAEARDQALAEAAEQFLPRWEASYDSATFTSYLIGYCNDEVVAKAAAEAWLRSQCLDAAGLEWTPIPQMVDDEYDQWLVLSRTSEEGTVLATDIVVRHRAVRTETPQES